jgi:hypothetical protein
MLNKSAENVELLKSGASDGLLANISAIRLVRGVVNTPFLKYAVNALSSVGARHTQLIATAMTDVWIIGCAMVKISRRRGAAGAGGYDW